MTTTKTMVCLANSRKHGERCVAGIETVDGSKSWIRPVSDRPSQGVSAVERQYWDGTEPRVLDNVSVPLLEPQPNGFQQENWLLDPTSHWRKVGRIGWDELCTLEQQPQTLWLNGHSTSAGMNDRVPVEQEHIAKDSLKLIRVNSVKIQVTPPWSADERPAVRAQFLYNRFVYALKVTDPVYEERFQTSEPGEYRLAESFLTVSLAEEYQGYFYKLVAAIIERADLEPGGRR